MKTNEMEIKTLDYKNAIKDSFLKLTVQTQIKNPVMFVVYLGCIMASIICCWSSFTNQLSSFDIQICVWLWFTILFANFAEAIAERKGKAQADTLKKSRTDLIAKVVSESGTSNLAAESLKKGMIMQ